MRNSAVTNHSPSSSSATDVTRCDHQCETPSFAAPSPRTRPIGLRRLMRHLRRCAAISNQNSAVVAIAPRNTIQPLKRADLRSSP